MDTKPCTKCSRTLPVAAFFKNKATKTGFSSWCRACHTADTNARRAALRLRAMMVVGGDKGLVCARCGFSDLRALCLDHVDGGGATHRKISGGPDNYYREVKRNPHLFQILCGNCNMIKRVENGEHPLPRNLS